MYIAFFSPIKSAGDTAIITFSDYFPDALEISVYGYAIDVTGNAVLPSAQECGLQLSKGAGHKVFAHHEIFINTTSANEGVRGHFGAMFPDPFVFAPSDTIYLTFANAGSLALTAGQISAAIYYTVTQE